MDGKKIKYWEGRTPPPEYFFPHDPYKSCPESNINIRKLCQYARQMGKCVTDLTYEEVQQFRNNADSIDGEVH